MILLPTDFLKGRQKTGGPSTCFPGEAKARQLTVGWRAVSSAHWLPRPLTHSHPRGLRARGPLHPHSLRGASGKGLARAGMTAVGGWGGAGIDGGLSERRRVWGGSRGAGEGGPGRARVRTGARGGLTPGPGGDRDLRVGGSRGGRRARDAVERRHPHGVARAGPQVEQRGRALAEPGLARHEGHARLARLAGARALAAAAQAQQRVRDVRAAARVGRRQPAQPQRQRRAAQAVLQVPRRRRRPWRGGGAVSAGRGGGAGRGGAGGARGAQRGGGERSGWGEDVGPSRGAGRARGGGGGSEGTGRGAGRVGPSGGWGRMSQWGEVHDGVGGGE